MDYFFRVVLALVSGVTELAGFVWFPLVFSIWAPRYFMLGARTDWEPFIKRNILFLLADGVLIGAVLVGALAVPPRLAVDAYTAKIMECACGCFALYWFMTHTLKTMRIIAQQYYALARHGKTNNRFAWLRFLRTLQAPWAESHELSNGEWNLKKKSWMTDEFPRTVPFPGYVWDPVLELWVKDAGNKDGKSKTCGASEYKTESMSHPPA
ncbi:MAG: hypothetical protein Q4E62_02065 [Sutterellaceae bacterium]|nr:hypothetical protein [Sutterellaceae bacterium]